MSAMIVEFRVERGVYHGAHFTSGVDGVRTTVLLYPHETPADLARAVLAALPADECRAVIEHAAADLGCYVADLPHDAQQRRFEADAAGDGAR